VTARFGVLAEVDGNRIRIVDGQVVGTIRAHVMPGDDEDAARRADALLGDG
jgi:hypothetical protein